MITMIRHALSRERGSVPLALLVVMIMAGLTSIVYARATADQRSVRADNEFTTAIHAAEAGVEEATFRLNNHLVVGSSAAGTGSAGDYDYAWTATKMPGNPWTVTSTGTGPDAVSRTVVAELTDQPVFFASLATHLGISFTGGNKADSYNSRTQVRCSGRPAPLTSTVSCYGIIASNGPINMGSSGGDTNYADRVRVHDWANPQNNGPQRCGPSNSIYCAPPFRENVDRPLDIRQAVPLVEEMLAGCPASPPSWRASDHATGSGNNRVAVLNPSHAPVQTTIGPVYCYGELHFDVNTTVPASFTADNGLFVVVRNQIKVEGAVSVNCPVCAGGFPAPPNRPAARRLQIFTLAQDTGSGSNVLAAVQVRQHAKIAAAIYAPDASCGNNQSNAQVEIYGSLVCKTVLNQGGWQFHYDEDLLGGLTSGEYDIHRWREE